MPDGMRLWQKRGIWYVETERGKSRSLQTRDGREARRLFAAIRREALAGRLASITGECGLTLGDFAREYEDWAKGAVASRSTLRANLLALGKLIEAAGKTCRLDRLSLRHADAIVAASRRAGLSPASINVYLRHARVVLNKAVAWGHLKANPLRGAKELPKERKPPVFLDRAGAARLLSGIEDLDLRRMVAAYLATGRRRTELLSLDWSDVDLGSGRYLVRRSKTHLSRWYPVSSTFRTILEAIPETKRRGRVFARWEHPDTVSHAVRGAMNKAGLTLRLHDLRHSFAAIYLEAGGGLKQLQELLGHTEYRTTEIYAHLGEDHLAEEVNRVRLGPVDVG